MSVEKSDSWDSCKLSIALQNPSRVQSVLCVSKWNRFMVCFCSYHDDVTARQIRKAVDEIFIVQNFSLTHSLHFCTGSKPAICTYPSCMLYLPNLRQRQVRWPVTFFLNYYLVCWNHGETISVTFWNRSFPWKACSVRFHLGFKSIFFFWFLGKSYINL